MKCTICKIGKMEDGRVTVTLQREDSIIVIKNVPALVCKNCSEYTLSEPVTRNIMKTAEQAIANNAEIEVLQYAA
jgi:YgiT-type zinc finger domain-containing protein